MADETKIIHIQIDLLKGLTDIAELQKKIDDLTLANKNLDKSNEEQANTYAANTVAIKEYRGQLTTLIRESGNEIKTTVEKLGYMQKLEADVSNLTLAYKRLSLEELNDVNIGGKVINDLKTKRAELASLEQSYGNYSKNVGNYSSATKMLGINLGQVMKEMPNFAISARIGIMSLTNNLPMLAESIKAVRLEQQELIAAGKEAPSMFGMITKSVFGLTGVMSIAMVLAQLYGADLIKWVGTLFKGADAIDTTTFSVKALNKVLLEDSGEAQKNTEKILELGVSIEKYKKGTGDAKNIVDDYNETLGVHYGKLKDVNDVIKLYPKYATEYIDWSIKMAASTSLIDDASKELLKTEKLRMDISMFKKEDLDKTTKYVSELVDMAEKLGVTRKRISDDLKSGKGFTDIADEITQTISSKAKSGFNGDNPLAVEFIKTFNEYTNTQGANKIAQTLAQLGTSKTIKAELLKQAQSLYPGDFSKAESDKQHERILSDFDYETKIMEAKAKQLQDNRERELELIDVDNTKKLNLSKDYISKLERLSVEGNKDATKKLKQAKIDAARYEIELEKEKNFEKLKINAKYDEIITQNNLENLKHQLNMVKVNNVLEEIEEKKYADNVYKLNLDSINRELISEELKNQKLLKLKNDYEENAAAIAEKYRRKREQDRINEIQVDIDRITANKEIMIQDIDAEYDLKQRKRQQEYDAKVGTEKMTAATIKAFKLETDLSEQEREIKKIDQTKAWAEEAMAIGRGVADFLGALGERELSDYEKKNKGKVGFEEAFAKKKAEIALRDAILQRSLSSFETIINTAAAIMKLQVNPGFPAAIPLAVATGILGATQLATIWAAPLPSYDANSSGSSNSNVTKTQVTEKFSTGGKEHPNTQQEADDLLRLTQKAELLLTVPQTKAFEGIISSMRSYGGSGNITSNVGVNVDSQTTMIASIVKAVLDNQKPPVMLWDDKVNFEAKMAQMKQNTQL